MLKRVILSFFLLFPLVFAGPLAAVELIMVEQQGCTYCITWKREIGPIYPKTDEGKFAPLRMIDIDDPLPADLTFARKVVFTPTFILIDNGTELARLEGYPGEDFFWGLLGMMLESETDFRETPKTGDQNTNG